MKSLAEQIAEDFAALDEERQAQLAEEAARLLDQQRAEHGS